MKPLYKNSPTVVLYLLLFLCFPLYAAEEKPLTNEAEFTSLFNGKNLTGWKAEGGARWQVKDGLIVGRQGPNHEAGDLFTEKSYEDFELSVIFKVVWPANTGVWYRYQSDKQAYQADILEYKRPFALTGSLYCTGKMFLAVNTNRKLVNRDDWNTLEVRAEGDRHQVFLNGHQVVDVRDDTSDRGRIGFQIHVGDQFERMRVMIKQVAIREL